jgi:P pilus assembly chaperone PapD
MPRAAILALILMSSLSSAFAAESYPRMKRCDYNSDKSAIVVVAGNATNKSYSCTASCKFSTKDQRAFTPFTCSFNLPANSKESVRCEKKGKGSGYFTNIVQASVQCLPR